MENDSNGCVSLSVSMVAMLVATCHVYRFLKYQEISRQVK